MPTISKQLVRYNVTSITQMKHVLSFLPRKLQHFPTSFINEDYTSKID